MRSWKGQKHELDVCVQRKVNDYVRIVTAAYNNKKAIVRLEMSQPSEIENERVESKLNI